MFECFNNYDKLIFNQSPYGICVVDENGFFLKANNSFCKMTGYSFSELASISFLDITHPDDIEYDKFCMNQLQNREIEEARIKKRYIHKNGDSIDIFVGVSPIFVKNVFKFYVCFFQDITKDKLLMDSILPSTEDDRVKLQELNQELEDFIYVASHDLKSPLRSISTYINLLGLKINNLDGIEKINDYIYNIKKSIRQCDNLLNDLLELSKSQQSRDEKKYIYLKQFLNQLISKELSSEIVLSNTTINIHGDGRIYGTEFHCGQVFKNLINNSIKYKKVDKNSIIDINIYNYKSKVYIEFSDNGIGVDTKYHNDIFKPFKRLHTSDKYEGSGLGLFICKKIIEKYNGSIKVRYSKSHDGLSLSILWGETKCEE